MGVDPVHNGSNIGVDTWSFGSCARLSAPGHDASEDVLVAAFNGAGQWAARVVLKVENLLINMVSILKALVH